MKPVAGLAWRLAWGTLAAGLAVSTAVAEPRSLSLPLPVADAAGAGELPAHRVSYDTESDEPLLVWLPGTGGSAERGPQAFFETVRTQGLRLLALSYRTEPAVSQVCTPARLRERPRCAAEFRQQRVWGDLRSGLIDDTPAEAIVPRLRLLLRHLVETDPAGHWERYWDGAEPRWSRIVLAGQSQGGGMAAYLAQSREVAGVLMFSGGWDHGPRGELAAWYRRASATPLLRFHASLHAQEPQAATLAAVYQTLNLPAAQVHVLDLPFAGRTAHTEGIGNPAYAPLWRQMLSSAVAAATPASR